MAGVHGKTTDISVDDSGGTLRNISTYAEKVIFKRAGEALETTTFQATGDAKTFAAGLIDGTMQVVCQYNATVAGYLNGIVNVSGSYQYGPAGSTAGYVKFTGEAICTNVSYEGPLGLVKITADFQLNGEVTVGTY